MVDVVTRDTSVQFTSLLTKIAETNNRDKEQRKTETSKHGLLRI